MVKTHARIQASDFQHSKAGIQGNLAKVKTIADHAKNLKDSGKNVAVDIVGFDLIDPEFLEQEKENDFLAGLVKREHEKVEQQFQKRHPDEFKQFGRINDLVVKHGDDALTPEEEQEIESLKASGILDVQQKYAMAMNSISGPHVVFSELNKYFEGVDDVHVVHGNWSLNYEHKLFKKGTYTDLASAMVTDGCGMNIIGANNTFETEGVFGPNSIQYDDNPSLEKSKAYKKFNLKKTEGKKAHIVQLHGPPNKAGMRAHATKTPGVGIDKLIDEHRPQLVECGHVHVAEMHTDEQGITYARSNDKIFYEHHFDDEGNYVDTDVFEYAA
jgi:Icc-related predicted phosphoesterase